MGSKGVPFQEAQGEQEGNAWLLCQAEPAEGAEVRLGEGAEAQTRGTSDP